MIVVDLLVVVAALTGLECCALYAFDLKRSFGRASYRQAWEDSSACRIDVHLAVSPPVVEALVDAAMRSRQMRWVTVNGAVTTSWSSFASWDTLSSWRQGGRELTTVILAGTSGGSDVGCFCRPRFRLGGFGPFALRFREDEVSRLAAALVATAER